MKLCYICAVELTKENSNKRSSYCKPCRRKSKNTSCWKSASKRYCERRAQIDKIKIEAGCVDCPKGTVWHPAALDFDHINPADKKFRIAAGVGKSWQSILEEISKCVIRCANHHRIKTVLEREHKNRSGFKEFVNGKIQS